MLYLGRLLARAQHAQDVKAELDVAAEVGQVTAIEAAATVSGLRGDDRPASGTPAPGSGAPWRGAPPRPERRIRRWSESSLRRTPTPRRPGPRCRSRPPGTASCAPTLANRRRAGAARRRPRRTVPARPWRASATTFRPPSSMRSGRWTNSGRPTSGDGPVSAGRPVDYEALSARSVARSPTRGLGPVLAAGSFSLPGWFGVGLMRPPRRLVGSYPPKGVRSPCSSKSRFSNSSTLTSLKVTTRTCLTKRAGRYMSHTQASDTVSYTHLRAHETRHDLV